MSPGLLYLVTKVSRTENEKVDAIYYTMADNSEPFLRIRRQEDCDPVSLCRLARDRQTPQSGRVIEQLQKWQQATGDNAITIHCK